jgi:MoaA/NifB/PqqE/SkfB family radical SAM enzyme
MIYTSTRGELLPCSWAKEGIGPNIKDKKIKDYFKNDEILHKLRKEMTTPGSNLETVEEICKNCRYQELHYGRSRRQASLKIQTNDKGLWPGIRNAVERFKKSGKGHIEDRIFEVQIKAFGNQCNLDCYMCIPYDSSTRLKTIHSKELTDETIFSNFAKTKIDSLSANTLDSIVDQIADIAPYIYNLKFIGGEPLVMKDFYNLLDKIVASGHSKKMMVKYQTNMSVLEFEKIKITKYIPEFERFEFTVSLDGIGDVNNYIRRRSNWDDIVRNIKDVKKFSNVEVNVNGTISFLSVLRFNELIEWFDQNNNLFKQINWSNIRGPAKLCANVLPDEIKNKLIPIYQNFPDIQNVLREDNKGYKYQDTLNYLLMNDKYYKNTKWEMDLFTVFPELENFYYR